MDDDLAALVKDDTRDKMGKAIDHVRHEMGGVRTGRASSALVEPLLVDYYGTPTPLRQLAGFSVPDAMLLVISPYDKGSLSAIEKAALDVWYIRNASLMLDLRILYMTLLSLVRGDRRSETALVQAKQSSDRRVRGSKRPTAGFSSRFTTSRRSDAREPLSKQL